MAEKRVKLTSLDSWGIVTEDTVEFQKEKTKKLKPHLLELALHIQRIMETYTTTKNGKYDVVWFLNDGTLLGAHRNGKMIAHDYDFDFGIVFVDESRNVANLEDSTDELKMVEVFITDKLDAKYSVEGGVDHGYARKINVVEKDMGYYEVKGVGTYFVSVDIQLFYSDDQDALELAYFKDNFNEVIRQKVKDLLPVKQIQFESYSWTCPNNTQMWLEANYGYIGTPARYNPERKKYEKVDEN